MSDARPVSVRCGHCGWTAKAHITDAEDDATRKDLSQAAWAHARVTGHNDRLDLIVEAS